MKIENVYRGSIALNILLYAAVLILPFIWPEFYTSEQIERIVWSNSVGAIIYIPTSIFYSIAVLYFISLVGLVFYQRWARFVFLSLTILVLFMGLGQGVFSQGPLDAFLNQMLSLLDGLVLALVFFSDLSQKFKTKA